jgi:hypothetical protein
MIEVNRPALKTSGNLPFNAAVDQPESAARM